MIDIDKINSGDITGSYNQVIQIVLHDGTKIEGKLAELLDRILSKDKEEVEQLKARITDKEKTIEDKTKIVQLLDNEIIRLKTQLSDKQLLLEQSETRFAKTFLENNGKDFTGSKDLYPVALKLLTEGKKKEALLVLDKHELLEQNRLLNSDKQQQADAWLLRADLLIDENKWDEDLNQCYDAAVEVQPSWRNFIVAGNHYSFLNNFEYAHLYFQKALLGAGSDSEKATTLNNLGNLQTDKNEYEKAEESYEEALRLYRELAATNPKTYGPDVAMTLNNLGTLSRDKNEYEKAEESYEEALELYRELASTNPETYRPNLAMTLNNLGNLQSDKNEYEKAEESYEEALIIRRELADTNPQTYLPNVATTLNNLAVLYSDKNEYEKAEESYKEALAIRRELAATNPQTHLPQLATTLNNLAVLYSDKNEYEKAEEPYEEALAIRRELATTNPRTYLPTVATTLNNLAVLHCEKNEYEKAEESYKESLTIRRELAAIHPKTYKPHVALTLNNLGSLHSNKNEYEKAEESYKESLTIRRELAVTNPKTYKPYVAITLINMSIYHIEAKSDKARSVQYVSEAILNLLPFAEIGFVQNYLKGAYQILEHWGFDPEAYVEELRKGIDT
jgi:tetratricopeptide (TPR) repeat protein